MAALPPLYKEGVRVAKKEQNKKGNEITGTDVKKAVGLPVPDAMACKIADSLNLEESKVMRYAYLKNIEALNPVLRNAGASIPEYTAAVQFVTRLVTGEAPFEAFKALFPEQVKDMYRKGLSEKEMQREVKAYHTSQLVADLLEQSIVPVHLMYQDIYHKAIGAQVILMNTAMSEMVKMNAAKCLLEVLRPPEKFQMEVEVKAGGSVIEELQATTRKLAEQQKKLLEQGASVKDLAEADIIEIVQEKGPEKVQ